MKTGPQLPILSRRGLIRSAVAIGGVAAMPAWARGKSHGQSHGQIRRGFDEVSGRSINLAVGGGDFSVGTRRGHSFAVNGSIPGPLVRLREGEPVRINVTNHLAEDTSIHWHGLLVPFQFDGVPVPV